MSRRPWTRAAVVLPAAVALLAAAGGSALAAAQARATGTQAVGPVAAWGAQASTSATAASQPGPLTLSWVGVDRGSKYFFVRNTGGLAVSNEDWVVTGSNPTGNATSRLDLTVCVGGSYLSLAGLPIACTGREQLVGSLPVGGSGTFTPAVTAGGSTELAVPVAGALPARVSVANGSSRDFAVTIGINVSRAQTTPGARTTSA